MAGTFQMYHGGTRWVGAPEIRSPKRGRYQGGLGLYFTNHYETARKYAKGNKIVHLVTFDANYTDIKNVTIPVTEVVEFLKSIRLKSRNEIIERIKSDAARRGRDVVNANIINNLMVNYDAGSGETGLAVMNFFVKNGIDGEIQEQSGTEQWLTVYNPKIIKSVTVVNPAKLPIELYELPPI